MSLIKANPKKKVVEADQPTTQQEKDVAFVVAVANSFLPNNKTTLKELSNMCKEVSQSAKDEALVISAKHNSPLHVTQFIHEGASTIAFDNGGRYAIDYTFKRQNNALREILETTMFKEVEREKGNQKKLTLVTHMPEYFFSINNGNISLPQLCVMRSEDAAITFASLHRAKLDMLVITAKRERITMKELIESRWGKKATSGKLYAVK